MLRDITLGQYFPGDTIIHRLDPRTKLIMVVVYIVALFMAKSWTAYGTMLVLLVCLIAVSQISIKTILRSLRPIIIVIVITAALNIFFTEGEALVEFWVIKITREGLVLAAKMALRLAMLITGTFMLTYTTSPIALTDGIESLFKPLTAIRFPVHELAMIMSLALRFVPMLIEETQKIISAQKARGADFETGNIMHRAKALLPVLVPLFINEFRRADDLADAMESRCYHGGTGRTRMKQLKLRLRDAASFIAGAATIFVIVLFNRLPW